MSNLMRMLYEALEEDYATPEEQAVLKREEPFFSRMEKELGEEDFDRLWGTLMEIQHIRSVSDFRSGFKLGVRLLMETGHPGRIVTVRKRRSSRNVQSEGKSSF